MRGFTRRQSLLTAGAGAAVSKSCLFLFQNLECSCIRRAAGFGRLGSGETAKAVNRIHFVETSLKGGLKCREADPE